MTWRCDSIACRENGRYVDSGKADVDALVSGVLKVTRRVSAAAAHYHGRRRLQTLLRPSTRHGVPMLFANERAIRGFDERPTERQKCVPAAIVD